MTLYSSAFFSVVKFLIGIYVVVVFADIILLLAQRGIPGDLRDTLIGMNVPAEFVTKKDRLRKRWDKIKEKLKKEEKSSYKVAIIEADALVDDLIKRMGYEGEHMGERLIGINPGQIENIEELKKAHEIRNRIIHEEDFSLKKEQVDEIFGYYENFLRYFEALD